VKALSKVLHEDLKFSEEEKIKFHDEIEAFDSHVHFDRSEGMV